MKYKLIQKWIEDKSPQLDWDVISENCSMDFIRKHKNNQEYLFSWEHIAKNKNIDIRFVQEHLHYFNYEQAIVSLNDKVLVDLNFIKNDPHVILGPKETKDEIEYYSIKFKDERHEDICKCYIKYRDEYNQTHNNSDDYSSCGGNYIYSCNGVKRYIYGETWYKKEYLLVHKGKLYLVKKKELDDAIYVLQSNLLKEKHNNYLTIMDCLSRNTAITFEQKYDTKDIINWKWESIMECHQVSKESFDKIKHLLKNPEQFEIKYIRFDREFLEHDFNLLYVFLRDTHDIQKIKEVEDVLCKHPKRKVITEKILKSEDPYTIVKILKAFTITQIKQNLHIDLDLEKVFSRNDADFELVKMIIEYRENHPETYFHYKIPWDIISQKEWATEELMLEHSHLPWVLGNTTFGW